MRIERKTQSERDRRRRLPTAFDVHRKSGIYTGLLVFVLAFAAFQISLFWEAAQEPTLTSEIVGAGLLGVAGFTFAVFFSEWRVKGYRSISEAEKSLGIPVSALIPELFSTRAIGRPAIDEVVKRQRSSFSASFRAALMWRQGRGTAHGGWTVSVCSALPAEGKTTVSICLARTAAIAGKRVVLVDCDGRRAVVSKSIPGISRVGVVEILQDGAAIDDALELDSASGAYIIRHSANGRIYDHANPGPMSHLLAELKSRFDLVVVDTAPVLALAESRTLASLTESVMLVVRWRLTPRRAARLAFDALKNSGAHVSSIILTRAQMR